jgi:cytochrome c biogenesis protein CcmG, thiol:disulfide interchange protein DsbE
VKALVALALLWVVGCAPAAGAGADATPDLPPDAAPDFELPALGGGSVHLHDHLGKDVVLLDFWATFCHPCLVAMPELDRLYSKYRARGFVVLGVSIDEASAQGRVRSEVAKLGIGFPILLDQETRVVSLYNPRATAPYSVLIGREGRVVGRREGYVRGDEQKLEAEILKALQPKN